MMQMQARAIPFPGLAVVGSVLLGAASTASADWSWHYLHPASASASYAYGEWGDQQAGVAVVGGRSHASRWHGTPASWVDLNPAGLTSSKAFDEYGDQQVGFAEVGGFDHASTWMGTSASWVDLNPAGSPSSWANGVTSGRQVGYANRLLKPPMYVSHAALWNGTAASFVDLHPWQVFQSVAYGASVDQVVGVTQRDTFDSPIHAALWTSASGSSWVDLNPAGAESSFARDVVRDLQVGYATQDGLKHASLWNGTASSWVDLNPDGASQSAANSIMDGDFNVIAGTALIDGSSHAGVWLSGSADGWFDLHQQVPSFYSSSVADSIWSTGLNRECVVSGHAFNTATGRDEACFWTLPAPSGTMLLGLGGLLAVARRR